MTKTIKTIVFRTNQIFASSKNAIRKLRLKSYYLYYYTIKRREILIGCIWALTGGTANHVSAIKRYSRFKTQLFPNKWIYKFTKKRNLVEYAQKEFYNKKINTKLVHSHVDPGFIKYCYELHKNGTPWVHTYHTLYFERDWQGGLKKWQIDINQCLLETAKHADVKIAVSKWLRDFLYEKYAIECIYIPNGVDVNKCDKANGDRFRAKYNYWDEFALFASSIADIKNPFDFIKLAFALPERKFIIAGRGFSEKAITEKFQIEIPKNLLVIGSLEHEDLLDLIAACKVFVVTSHSEGLPTVLMEAMALQKEVVGCDLYGTKEVIDNNDCGYIYQHNTFDDLKNKTIEAFENTSKGVNARLRILENYDWQQIVGKIDSIYESYIRT